MSRRDTYHKIIKDALIADGWKITHDPYTFYTDPQLSTDLGAERLIAAERGLEKIAVEVKSFLDESQVADLEKAIGQYILYRRLLRNQEPDRVLYLAVPRYAFDDIFTREVGKIAIEESNLHLIVYDVLQKGWLLWRKND